MSGREAKPIAPWINPTAEDAAGQGAYYRDRARFIVASGYVNAHEIAATQQAANKSDPFTYNRVRSHLTSGVADYDDYSPVSRRM